MLKVLINFSNLTRFRKLLVKVALLTTTQKQQKKFDFDCRKVDTKISAFNCKYCFNKKIFEINKKYSSITININKKNC